MELQAVILPTCLYACAIVMSCVVMQCNGMECNVMRSRAYLRLCVYIYIHTVFDGQARITRYS